MKPHGTVSFSRLSGDFELVGSRIRTSGAVALRINTAEVSSEFGEEGIYPRKQLIEVYLSPNQFSELLTTMNVSSGVPCTIKQIQGRDDIEKHHQDLNVREHSELLLETILSELDDQCNTLIEQAEKLTCSKKQKEQLKLDIRTLKSHFKSNIPFVNTVFQEQMDKVVVEAKSDVDALVTHTVNQLGIESLKSKQYLLNE